MSGRPSSSEASNRVQQQQEQEEEDEEEEKEVGGVSVSDSENKKQSQESELVSHQGSAWLHYDRPPVMYADIRRMEMEKQEQ